MDIVIVLVSITFGVLVGHYVWPFIGKEVAALRAEIEALHQKVDALIDALKQKL